MGRLWVLGLVGFVAVGFVGLSAPGCQQQQEGQQCSLQNVDVNGTSLDCGAGLACVSLGGQTAVCCPPSGATNPACIPGAIPGTGGATASSSVANSSSSSASGSGGGGASASSSGTATSAGGGGAAAASTGTQ